VKKVLAGKGGRLDDEELEYLAREITKLGFKLGFARAYASGPSLMVELVHRIEQQEEQLKQIRKLVGCK
ncbi:MAG: V-type ATPase 116kDa subunit family protein, partial [Chlorobi bacterium]|nr:V-type ATPase 116kDa subunit family protein [Chlorobiota bacterium]